MRAIPALFTRVHALGRAIANLIQLGLALRGYGAASKIEPFPKAIFELPPSATASPDGQSSAYLDLAVMFWQTEWSKPGNGASSQLEAALRVIYTDVQRAHALERRLLDKLKGGA